MPTTYNPQMTLNRDKVRFLAHDNIAGKMVMDDSEIDWVVSVSANIFMAAAEVAEGIFVRYERQMGPIVQTKKVGDLTITYDTKVITLKFYQDLAESLRRRGKAYQGPWAGGVDLNFVPDPTAQPPVFTQGEFDDQQVSDLSTNPADNLGTTWPNRWGI